MAHTRSNKRRRGLDTYQGVFMVLTLIVMIIVVLSAKDFATAILLISLMTNFLIISSQLTLIFGGYNHGAADCGKEENGFCRLDRSLASLETVDRVDPTALEDGVTAELFESKVQTRPSQETFDTPHRGNATAMSPLRTKAPDSFLESAAYPGAIDFKGIDSPDVGGEVLGLFGSGSEALSMPYDDDGNGLMALQARSRNEPERARTGVYRRKALVDRHVGEELDEHEKMCWWGAEEM
ncbi:hypothetical protein ElyMa_002588600 [Elysia marginata]|uniref:Uncharacterized protein n=1 Tax=Elysia marginata TaxID=1093978 RepID=A0AAV4GZS6_9GAST|nr:hypothetical protein ElyMa_002588600 [Elysia marginata]